MAIFYQNNSLTKSKMCENRIFKLNLLLKVKSCQTFIIGLTKPTYTETRWFKVISVVVVAQHGPPNIVDIQPCTILDKPFFLQHGCPLS